jgi:hypothetical protein
MEEEMETAAMEMDSEEVISRSTRKKKKYIFVIRSEHALQDWNTIDIMLGGNGTTNEIPLKNTLSSNTHHRNKTRTTTARSYWGFEPKDIPNKTLSEIGRNNLCHALCDEIQIYKRVLSLAVNLSHKTDDSLDELLMTCPNEIRDVRRCDEK